MESAASPQRFDSASEYNPGVVTSYVEDEVPSCHSTLVSASAAETNRSFSPSHKVVSAPSVTVGATPEISTSIVSASVPQRLLTLRINAPDCVVMKLGFVDP